MPMAARTRHASPAALSPEAAARIAALRLAAQQIARPRFTKPGELVAFMGAVQAQDPAAARWAVGLRLGGPGTGGVAAIERALAKGTVIRTHVLRWTWQLVAPADLPWMLPLVTARLMARAARRHRELGLDAAAFRRSHAAIARALAGGAHRTRAELGAALRAGGVAPDGARLSHLLGHAELHGLICSGAPRDKRPTYALVEERAPRRGAPRTRGEAVAMLARRYFESRGPATAADFAWWSGLAPAEARAGLDAVRAHLTSETAAGAVYWYGTRAARLSEAALAEAALARAYLLPAFDEYLIAYRDRAAVLAPEQARRLNAGGGLLAPCIVVGGRVAGTWRRTLDRRGTVTIALAPFAPPDSRTRAAINEAAERYAAFLGLEPSPVWPR
jgi:Winged helix DNA-binding domain